MSFHETLDEAKRLWEAGKKGKALGLLLGWIAGHHQAEGEGTVHTNDGGSGQGGPPNN